MPHVAQLFFKTAVVFLIIGIGIGLHMASTADHTATPAHAHFNLLGWVTSAIFGGYYALNPSKAERRISRIHYGVYTLGLVILLQLSATAIWLGCAPALVLEGTLIVPVRVS